MSSGKKFKKPPPLPLTLPANNEVFIKTRTCKDSKKQTLHHLISCLQIQGEPDWKMPLQPGDIMGPPLPLPPVPPTLTLQVTSDDQM